MMTGVAEQTFLNKNSLPMNAATLLACNQNIFGIWYLEVFRKWGEKIPVNIPRKPR